MKINIKKIAKIDGINDALFDIKTNNIKKYKSIDEREISSLIYNMHYINLYNKVINKHLNKEKANIS